MNTESRREFEEWARDKVTSLEIDTENGEYFWVETHLAWEAWQAARERLTKELDEANQELESMHEAQAGAAI